MSVAAYQAMIDGELDKFVNHSNKIGGEIAKLGELVKDAFNAQLEHITLAAEMARPDAEAEKDYFGPTATVIYDIQARRELMRHTSVSNHFFAVSEGLPALNWVNVRPFTAKCVKDNDDVGRFYIVRIVNEFRDKNMDHVEWARAWMSLMDRLRAYVDKFHTNGLMWNVKHD